MSRKNSVNFIAPYPLDVCRQRLQALDEPAGTGWHLLKQMEQGGAGTWRFLIWRLAERDDNPRPGDIAIEGFMQQVKEGETHIIGKVKGKFVLVDEVSLHEMLVLISLLIILSAAFQKMIGAGSVGLAGVICAVAFIIWRRLNFSINRRHLMARIEAALDKDKGIAYDHPSAYIKDKIKRR